MRVLQLIDSLRPGGAEKMAVNIANALLPHLEVSFLCCTRTEGMLKDDLKPQVGYLFLNKKSSFDPRAILKLKKFIQENDIGIVHAHSTSFFLAGILKLIGSRFKLIWHDHYGESENMETRDFKILKKFSRYFDGIISVNTVLKEWALNKLNCKKVVEIKNFIPEPNPAAEAKIKLGGNENDFKIICVANLRPQKDHFNLLKAFEMLKLDKEISLHLIGEDPGTSYSASILKAIQKSPVTEKIFYYGAQHNVMPLLKQADMGVLSSRSEGLPLILLEYGFAGLPIVCTNTGKCSEIINGYGMLVIKEDSLAFSNAIKEYVLDKEKSLKNSVKIRLRVKKYFSEDKVIKQILNFYNN